MIKHFCDHCNTEMHPINNYHDMEIETLDDYYRCDLCKKCSLELEKMMDKMVEQFLNREM